MNKPGMQHSGQHLNPDSSFLVINVFNQECCKIVYRQIYVPGTINPTTWLMLPIAYQLDAPYQKVVINTLD